MSSKLFIYRGNEGPSDLYFKLDTDTDKTIHFYTSAGVYNLLDESTSIFYLSYSLVNLYKLNNLKDGCGNNKFLYSCVIANTEYKSDIPLTRQEIINFIDILNKSNDCIYITYNFIASKESPIILNLLNLALYN